MFRRFLYSAVPDQEQGSEKGDQNYMPPQRILLILRVSLFRLYIVLIHVFVIVSSILISWPEFNNSCAPHKLLKHEIPWAENIVQYEEVTFAPSGFAKGPEPATLYEGIPTPWIDERWRHLTSVGMYSLTPSEYKELDLDTAQVIKHPGQYLVTIEVFHQLHCLNYLRKAVYGTSSHKESDHSKSMHLGNLFGNLYNAKTTSKTDIPKTIAPTTFDRF
ncbi:uncharacterized protein PAC_05472 [Phialocephala subalpina]|uniref:Uncharacterized protein n=1 Tax=Phialocephala subalpina TaxID=576137 RepID=A0A1L7WS32_9HELO|nr:uncharacterized protein PAC_05472 [Phialocephala subalpina]